MNKLRRRIIFRADGNSQIGLGHVVRSLALAAILRDEFECVLAIQSPSEELQNEIKKSCHGIISLPPCSSTEERFRHELAAYISKDEIVVLDGYTFGTAYQESIKSREATLVCIDDIHSYHFVADAVINQAGGVTTEAYTTAPYTKLCLGPAYALLRPPFLEAAKKTHTYKFPYRILLNMGGADPANHTLEVAQQLSQLPAASPVEVVVGSAYMHLQQLKAWLGKHANFTLHTGLDAEAMCRLMQRCQVAVTSPSGVAYEYCSVGGLLFVQQTAGNQADIKTFLVEEGLALDYQDLPKLNDKQLTGKLFADCLQQQRTYFTGDSEIRLRKLFRDFSLSKELLIRKATPDDLMLVHAWANDPEVRSRSFNSEPISLETHTFWYNSRLNNPACCLYIAEAAGKPAAQIRFDLNEDSALISYLIDENFRGKGLSHTVLLEGIATLLKEKPPLKMVEGLVQPDNIASVRAFEKAGFAYAEPDPKFPDAHRFVLAVQAPGFTQNQP